VRRKKNSTEVNVAMLTLVGSFSYGKEIPENKNILYCSKDENSDCSDAHAQIFVYTKHCPHNKGVCT
jgi:hypothetical protein